jgi:excisionase family DNA binding protein
LFASLQNAMKAKSHPQAPANPLPSLATVAEVACYLAVSRSKVYQMMDAGHMPYVKLGGCRRIAWEDVKTLVATSRVASH